ncbi:MAG: GlcG/HbpS family heme-binding protein [Steroidobacteraceae bacterium]
MKTLTTLSILCGASALLTLGAAGPAAAQTPGSHAHARARTGYHPPQFATIPGPSSNDSLKAIAASFAEARKLGISVSCAVVDMRGDLVAFARMDGASFLTASLAQGKALSSALFGIPSSALGRMAASPLFSSVNASVGDRMVPAQGAVPIVRAGDHRVIGAIGCSGGAPPQDEASAKAGLAKF